MSLIQKCLAVIIISVAVNVTANATVGVNGFSAPAYVEYNNSMSEKKTTVKNILENAALYDSSTIYIYYHDSKSKDMAAKIQSRIQDKLPPHTTLVLLDQVTGTPKYPYQYTPDGVAIVSKNGKCIKCNSSMAQ